MFPTPSKRGDNWNPNLISLSYGDPFSNRDSSFQFTRTFQFARTDEIATETANIILNHLREKSKQEKNNTIQFPTSKQSGTDADAFYGGPYRHLDPQEIRVIEIHPGHFYDNLRGTLHHCSLDCELDGGDGRKWRPCYVLSSGNPNNPVRYTALSHMCEDAFSETDTTIRCDGFNLKITPALDMALRYCRQTDHSVNMWISQVCINQTNAREKELHAQLTTKIYTSAHNIVAWLGEATEGSDQAFELLAKLGTVLRWLNHAPPPQEFERASLPGPTDLRWKHLRDLLSREWFGSLSIITEVIPSRVLWLMCGKTTTYWQPFSTCVAIIYSSSMMEWFQSAPDGQALVAGLKAIYMLHIQRLSFGGVEKSLPLLDMLTSFRDAKAKDPRDKVYGLLSVCLPTGIQVSYDHTTSVAAVYHAAAKHVLENMDYSLAPFLCCVDHESVIEGLPSWVPDWSVGRQTTSLGYSSTSQAIYNASGNRKTRYSFSPGGRGLHVRGKVFDFVERVGKVCSVADLAITDPRNANQWLVPWTELAQECFPYPSGLKIFDAFWHMLVAGQDGEWRQKSPASFSEIFSLLLDKSTGKSPTFPDQVYSPRQLRPKGKGRLELENLKTRVPGRTYQEIRRALRLAVQNRRPGRTGKRYIGLLPRQSQSGDAIVILDGCHIPFVVRKAEGGGYRLIGECYVYGIMDGEILQMEDIPELDIEIV